MLSRLYIKNIALIEEADINFEGKLNVLSGETGSGKSVILDSINFVLGSKADKSMIRYGCNECSVKAEFLVERESEVLTELSDMDIESDGEVIITRKFTADGKGGIKINGNSVSAAMLKRVTSRLVDVHGQSEHFFLLSSSNQLKVIDNLCKSEIKGLKHSLMSDIVLKKQYLEQISQLGGNEQERERKIDLLSYQIGELEKADIKVGEFEELKEKKLLIDNAEKLLNAANAVKEILSGDNGCSELLSLAARQASAVANVGEEYSKLYERIKNAEVEIDDISETAEDLADGLSFDGEEAERIEERLSLLKALFKKYGRTEEEVLNFLSSAKECFDALKNAEATVEKLNGEIDKINRDIYSLCKKLTALRKETAEEFAKRVVAELKTLNIPNACFEVEFSDYGEETAYSCSQNGCDDISFMFSANKGEPLKPLNKVISGGEMSRFMLAVKTCLKGINGISTYIFDEIDAGISGYTAKTVAEKFVDIGAHTQIIAVSHLPQVCAAADAQFLISKSVVGEKTVTLIKRLKDEERADEIVRLTGGGSSRAATEHAKELLAQFGH